MLFRPTIEADLDRVLACTVTEPISWIPPDRYSAELADRQYRPEWTWIAEDNGQILARALWWGMSDSAHPLALDCVYVHDSVPASGSPPRCWPRGTMSFAPREPKNCRNMT